MNADQIWDRAIDAVCRIGDLAQLKDMVFEANQAATTTCGNCNHWMKVPNCPREKGVMKGGPSMNSPACSVFSMEPRAIALKDARMEKAREFATQHGLPIP